MFGEAKNAETYRSARSADAKEIGQAGLLGTGRRGSRLVRTHLSLPYGPAVLCFAPARRGKGVRLVIPSLLTWPGSAIVHDIKGENWQLTAGLCDRRHSGRP
ncbi:type IV secretory system conjugative DNA transfer family protein [Bradyrhizobium nanningense]|uniref:type IV secretory system conjugative DNA transfer family protein n=1 Tax=Bradyrhizobium nanningense TaxID=1325118 RepID=UPI003D321D38